MIGLLAAGEVLLWSFNYIAGKIALEHLAPMTLVPFRLVLAGVIYLMLFWGTRRPSRPVWSEAPRFILLGIFGVLMNQGGFTVALDYTSVGHVAIILAMGPVLVLLLARIIGQETLSPVKIAGVILCFCGIAMLAIEQGLRLHTGGLAGDLIAMGGSIGFAVFTVFSKRVRHRYDPIGFNTFTHLTAAVLMLPLAIHQGMSLDWHRVGWQGWAAMSYMAVFSSVFGYLIFYKLLGHLSATQVSSFNYLLPIGATTLGVVVLGEQLNRGFFVAAALVLTGVWLAQSSRWQAPPAD
jgi:drug/metabolite transporter (DMT)-like permease